MNRSIEVLFEIYLKEQASESDILELMAHFKIPNDEVLLKKCIFQELQSQGFSQVSLPNLDQRLDNIQQNISKEIRLIDVPKATKNLQNKWLYIATIAACITFFVFLILQHQSNDDIIVRGEKNSKIHTIRPGANNATLTLADGRKINISDIANSKLREQAGIEIIKTFDGKLIYQSKTVANPLANQLYNTVETPKGGQYQIKLPDGTDVWLNAGSSLKYPISFVGLKARKVELKGEAYFEVAKNIAQPFRVVSTKQEVEVLGTHFNISAYADDVFTKTTLLEGKVRVEKHDSDRKSIAQKTLYPGEQSFITNSKFDIASGIDIDADVAWKDGYFVFVNEPIEEIMRKISRWYDVEVIYKGNMKNKAFAGTVSRFDNISKLLNMIESTNTVHFQIKERSVIVMD